jgi:hypothetical protein
VSAVSVVVMPQPFLFCKRFLTKHQSYLGPNSQTMQKKRRRALSLLAEKHAKNMLPPLNKGGYSLFRAYQHSLILLQLTARVSLSTCVFNMEKSGKVA